MTLLSDLNASPAIFKLSNCWQYLSLYSELIVRSKGSAFNGEQLKINYSFVILPNRKHHLLRIQIGFCQRFCTLIC